ncbi:hypothetical protein VJ918_00885 [Adlercreutzia sp. R21]|uniref:Doubled CXXCH motif domain-containing protein n=1 Tax=Adlercreutzia wanghongyangiae TaxID=3111451 RepID=A0ABU6IGC7_9ACTN|nr:hypothetical protein [Adlercreutzia sp. R21]MEC4175503.1 hypothetical protein [Adlercreutzia sp. R7]MEC4183357.1 hypothetical protein [Adlercreutzia sp. R21]
MKGMKRKGLAAILCASALTLGLAGCAPETQEVAPSDGLASNDMVVRGEYTPYDPSVDAAAASGKAIEGSEEEQLQQERIAGGAVGAVQSTNLEPLEGITDYSAGEYVPVYGIACDIPEVVHGDTKGTACTTCHTPDGSGVGIQMPASHVDQNLTDGECLTCHDM